MKRWGMIVLLKQTPAATGTPECGVILFSPWLNLRFLNVFFVFEKEKR